MQYNLFRNQKGQIGETLTWGLATIIIVIFLVVSVFVSSAYFSSKKKVVKFKDADYLPASSFFSWLLTKDEKGDKIYEQIKSKESLNEFNGGFALDIFKEFYGNEYLKVWVGIDFSGLGLRKNNYFGIRPTEIRGGDITMRHVKNVIEVVPLNEDKTVELNLAPKT